VVFLWLAYLFSRVAGGEFGSEIGGLIFLGALILFVLILLWRLNVVARIKFRISSIILILPYVIKFAFNHGLKNFKPGSEPDGFRGIKWRTEFSTAFSNAEKVKESKTIARYEPLKFYLIEGDDLRIGLAKLESIEHAFWNKRFQGAHIQTKGYENWVGVKQATFEKFGRGFQLNRRIKRYEWQGKAARATLDYEEESKLGRMSIISKDSLREVAAYVKQKAEEGAKKRF